MKTSSVNNTVSQNKRYMQGITRKHSSRMRTVRCSSRLPGECLPGGCLHKGFCPGGVCLGGCLPRGCLPWLSGRHPPMNRMTTNRQV